MKQVKKWLGRAGLWVFGWRPEAEIPDTPKFILVGYPHTSTWDFPLFILTAWALGVRSRWAGKKSLFKGPLGGLFRALGGVPVDRSGGKNMVATVVELFEQNERLIFGIAPSGSRSYTSHWRSGFYHMARAADVPLVLGSVDFARRTGCLLEVIHLTGDVAKDMDRIRAGYAQVRGRNPERQTPVRLKQEGEE
jgi:1-acyl-sn-glycerol-3-phosphate acyltransferase